MKQQFLILLVICVYAAAMVPRERKAVNTEEHKLSTISSSSVPTKVTNICAAQTPCAWSIYKPVIKLIEANIQNDYCICGAGLVCVIDEDDVSVSSYVHRCRSPTAADSDIQS